MKKYFVLMVLTLCGSLLFGQQKLTLENAISIALQRNSDLIISKNNISGNEANVKSAYGDLAPNLSATGSWDWDKTSINETEIDARNYRFNVGGDVTLFNGLANYANISKSKGELESAEYSLTKQKQDVVYQTMEYYYAVLNAEEIVKVREENVNYNQKLLETIQERNRLGSVPVADVYTQQVQLGNAKVDLIRQKNIYENAKSTLLNYLAIDVFEEYDFDNPFTNIDSAEAQTYVDRFGDISDLVEQAFDNRYDYKAQLLNVENNKNNLTMAKGGHYGILSGSYGFSSSSIKFGDMFDTKVYSAGLRYSLPIFANFDISTNVEFAEIGVKNSEEGKRKLERLIKIQIKQGYLDVQQGKEALDVAVQNVTAALENRRINNERYNLGSGTILDVLQSTRDYQDAISAKINAEFFLYRVSDKLLNLIGLLDHTQYENQGE